MPEPSVTAEDVASAIRGVLYKSRGVEYDVSPSTELASLGLESLEVVEIFIVLEEQTGCAFVVDQADDLRVVADVLGLKRA